jgi:hypothetical protein
VSEGRGKLAVKIDGEALPEAEARAFWERFSAHMEANKGDLAGFAKAEGLASVHPGLDAGGPVLLGSRSAAQRAYVSVAKGSGEGEGGGSSGHQGGGRASSNPRGGQGKRAKRR